MPLNKPIKIGEPIELTERKFGKTMLLQRFYDGLKNYDYNLFDYNNGTPVSVILPVTPASEVVAIHQFRHGANEYIYELPGGTPNQNNEKPEEITRRELGEETGYLAEKIIVLAKNPIWFDPASVTVAYWPCLGLNCRKIHEQNLDDTEYIKVKTFPLESWLLMIMQGLIADSKSIVTTYLALPFLT